MVLPKEMRIKGYKSFNYIHKSSKRYNSSSILLKVAPSNKNLIHSEDVTKERCYSCRCAISISNKVTKKAVTRNRIRRILHEHLKLRLVNQKSNSFENWLLFSLRSNASDKSLESLLKEVDYLLFKAGLSND